ncbi:MAG: hypothetical protein ACR2Q4_24660 [Geminicoccaceae bacterium]
MDGLPEGDLFSTSAEWPVGFPQIPSKGRQRILRRPHTAVDIQAEHISSLIAKEFIALAIPTSIHSTSSQITLSQNMKEKSNITVNKTIYKHSQFPQKLNKALKQNKIKNTCR